MVYGKSVGIDCKKLLSTISTGAASRWQLSNLGSKMDLGDFDPSFFIKHFVKDMKIVQEEAQGVGIDLSILNKICEI